MKPVELDEFGDQEAEPLMPLVLFTTDVQGFESNKCLVKLTERKPMGQTPRFDPHVRFWGGFMVFECGEGVSFSGSHHKNALFNPARCRRNRTKLCLQPILTD